MTRILCIFLLLIFLILLSCAMPDEGFTFDKPKFSNMSDACEWVNQNIRYKSDYYDDWKTPQKTLDDGYGDCEDMAILLMAIMKYQKGYQPELLVVKIEENKYHAIVKHSDNYYDATSGETRSSAKYEIVNRYDYTSALYTAEYVKNY